MPLNYFNLKFILATLMKTVNVKHLNYKTVGLFKNFFYIIDPNNSLLSSEGSLYFYLLYFYIYINNKETFYNSYKPS